MPLLAHVSLEAGLKYTHARNLHEHNNMRYMPIHPSPPPMFFPLSCSWGVSLYSVPYWLCETHSPLTSFLFLSSSPKLPLPPSVTLPPLPQLLSPPVTRKPDLRMFINVHKQKNMRHVYMFLCIHYVMRYRLVSRPLT